VDDSFKCRNAFKYSIPVVTVDYLYACAKSGCRIDPYPYTVFSSANKKLLSCGVIAGNIVLFIIFVCIHIIIVCIHIILRE